MHGRWLRLDRTETRFAITSLRDYHLSIICPGDGALVADVDKDLPYTLSVPFLSPLVSLRLYRSLFWLLISTRARFVEGGADAQHQHES